MAQSGRGYLQGLTEGPSRAGAVLAVFVAFVVLIGARSLINGPLPVIREFFDTGQSSSALLAQWWTGWRESGFGESAVAPGVVPGLGALGTVLLGAVGLVRRLLIVLPLLMGALGAWKLLLRTGSTKGRAAMLAAYALNPVGAERHGRGSPAGTGHLRRGALAAPSHGGRRRPRALR